jgi:hypothetical protein
MGLLEVARVLNVIIRAETLSFRVALFKDVWLRTCLF